MITWNLTPRRAARLVACFEALDPVFTSAGLPRLAAWALLQRERALLPSPPTREQIEPLRPLFWAAREDPPSRSTFLWGRPSEREQWIREGRDNLWQVPAGPLRDAARLALSASGALEDPLEAPARPRRHGLIRATEALERALFEAGLRAPVAACVAFRQALSMDRAAFISVRVAGWLRHAGPPARPWAWVYSGDASGLADQVRAALPPLEPAPRAAVEEALCGLLAKAGLPPEATGETRHLARVNAVQILLQQSAPCPARAVALLQAAEAALAGDPAEVTRRLDACPARTQERHALETYRLRACELGWLAQRLRPFLRDEESRAALRVLVSAP